MIFEAFESLLVEFTGACRGLLGLGVSSVTFILKLEECYIQLIKLFIGLFSK